MRARSMVNVIPWSTPSTLKICDDVVAEARIEHEVSGFRLTGDVGDADQRCRRRR